MRLSRNPGGVGWFPEMWPTGTLGFCPARLIKTPPEQGFCG